MLRSVFSSIKRMYTYTILSCYRRGYLMFPPGIFEKQGVITAAKIETKGKFTNNTKYLFKNESGGKEVQKQNIHKQKEIVTPTDCVETLLGNCERILHETLKNVKDKTDHIKPVTVTTKVFRANTAKDDERLSRLENIDEPALVETEKLNVDGVNAIPKILAKKSNEPARYYAGSKDGTGSLSLTSISLQYGMENISKPLVEYATDVSDKSRRPGSPDVDIDVDELAKRCLDTPLKHIDKRLLQEMEKLGVPHAGQTALGNTELDNDILQMDMNLKKTTKPIQRGDLDLEARQVENDIASPITYAYEANLPLILNDHCIILNEINVWDCVKPILQRNFYPFNTAFRVEDVPVMYATDSLGGSSSNTENNKSKTESTDGCLPPLQEKIRRNVSCGVGPVPIGEDLSKKISLNELVQRVRYKNRMDDCKLFRELYLQKLSEQKIDPVISKCGDRSPSCTPPTPICPPKKPKCPKPKKTPSKKTFCPPPKKIPCPPYKPKKDKCKPKRDPCKPKVDPCKPKVDPCKPKVDPCKPKVDPCRPKVDPCRPKVDPCKPKVHPCKPKKDPCKPKKKRRNSTCPPKKRDPCAPKRKKSKRGSKKKRDPCAKFSEIVDPNVSLPVLLFDIGFNRNVAERSGQDSATVKENFDQIDVGNVGEISEVFNFIIEDLDQSEVENIEESSELYNATTEDIIARSNMENIESSEIYNSRSSDGLDQLNVSEITLEDKLGQQRSIEILLQRTAVYARDFEPWVPIPSWPYPRKPTKKRPNCPTWAGCKALPLMKDGGYCKPTMKPCKGFPKRLAFSPIPSVSQLNMVDVGDF